MQNFVHYATMDITNPVLAGLSAMHALQGHTLFKVLLSVHYVPLVLTCLLQMPARVGLVLMGHIKTCPIHHHAKNVIL
jgi:hypothetical protein